MKLTNNERRVLTFLVNSDGESADGFNYHHFASIGSEVNLEKRDVRKACRSLRRKSFAKFSAGLFTEDGEMYGSGYCATRAGVLILAELDKFERSRKTRRRKEAA